MVIFIYIFGCICSFILQLYFIHKTSDITVADIVLFVLISTLSWISLILCSLIIGADIIVIKKKRKKKIDKKKMKYLRI